MLPIIQSWLPDSVVFKTFIPNRSRLFLRVGLETIYASSENSHFFFHYIMSSSDIPKLLTEYRQRIGHIFENSILKIRVFKTMH